MKPTAFQDRVLTVPESYNLALLGGRGGGKTTTIALLALRHCEQFGERARPLIVRETLAGLRELEDKLDRLLNQVYPRGVRANRTEHVWRLPNGAVVETGYLVSQDDFNRYQGRSFSLLIGEEAGQFKTLKWFDMLRSNLRVKLGVPCRTVIAANPGGRLHSVLHQRYARHVSWRPFLGEDGETWVHSPSTLKDNPHLPPDYGNKLVAASGRDKELLRAWTDGDWSIARGAYFAGCLDMARQMLPAATGTIGRLRKVGQWAIAQNRKMRLVAPNLWLPHKAAYTFIAADWGQSSPSVAFACVRLLAPVGPYPRWSLILLDEVSSADPDDWSIGLQWSPGRLADGIRSMAERLHVRPEGVIDDARGLGSDETLIKFMQSQGLHFRKPAKGRLEGWSALRELMTNSYEANGRPGFWASERCCGFWATAPSCPRDPLHPEDLDTAAIDHWLDAARYAATNEPRIVRSSHKPV